MGLIMEQILFERLAKFHGHLPCSCILIAATKDQVSKGHKQRELNVGEDDTISEILHSSYRHFIGHIAKSKHIWNSYRSITCILGLSKLDVLKINVNH